MATVEEVRLALKRLAEQLAAVDDNVRGKYVVDRTISCHLTDLGTTFSAQLTRNGLDSITTDSGSAAQIRLTTSSDDLIALTEGRLAFPLAWASGRIRVDASVMDLLRLRSLL